MGKPRRLPSESDQDFKVRIADYFKTKEPINGETADALAKRTDDYFAEIKAAEAEVDERDEAQRRRDLNVEAALKRRIDRRNRGVDENSDGKPGASLKDFFAVARQSGMDIEVAEKLITPGMTLDEFRGVALDYLSKRNQKDIRGAHQEIDTQRGSPRIEMGADLAVTGRSEAMTEALSTRMLAARRVPAILTQEQADWCKTREITDKVGLSMRIMDGKEKPANARASEYLECSIVEMAAECIGYKPKGSVLRTQHAYDILQRAWHSTGDFPAIFENSLNKSLLARYSVAMPTYREIASERTFQDFRPHPQIRSGDFPQPQALSETGELKYGTASDSKEVASVKPYGVVFSISRFMIVNDDIGGIDQILGSTGNGILRFENTTFFAMMLSAAGVGPTLNQDGLAVYESNTHKNYQGTFVSGSSGPPSVTLLGAGRAALRVMKSLDGQFLNVNPTIMLTGPNNETAGDQLVTQITPALTSSVNPFTNKLRNITEAQIPANTSGLGEPWFLFADPQVLPCFVYGFLAGVGGPRVRTDEPFGVQGVRVSLEHDFGVGAIDFRGSFQNCGKTQ